MLKIIQGIILLSLVTPLVLFAECEVGGQTYPDGHPACASQELANQQQSGPGLQYNILSPLNVDSFEALIVAILNTLLIFAVPIIVIFIIYAGFNYVMAQGNPEKITTATRQLTYALIGGVLILGAVALAQVVREIVCSFSTDPTECSSI